MNYVKKIIGWPAVWFCWYLGWGLTKLWRNNPKRNKDWDQWHPYVDLSMVIQDWAGLEKPWRRNKNLVK
jgi:hypothetical protein